MKGITTTIIAKDEEKTIGKAIKSVLSFSSEVIVILDSRTKDKTAQTAKKLGAKVFKRVFDNFANQKNYAASKASGEWIFSLDADEIVTPKLAEEIKRTISDTDCDAFLIPRRNFLLGGEIKHTRWSPDKHIWLWRKEKGGWVGEVHEEVKVTGKIGELLHPKIHYQYKKIYEFLEMVNFYTQLEAEEKIKRRFTFSYFKFFYYPFRSFVGRYFLKLGFLDGWRGFVLSYLMAIYRLVTWVKVWENEKAS